LLDLRNKTFLFGRFSSLIKRGRRGSTLAVVHWGIEAGDQPWPADSKGITLSSRSACDTARSCVRQCPNNGGGGIRAAMITFCNDRPFALLSYHQLQSPSDWHGPQVGLFSELQGGRGHINVTVANVFKARWLHKAGSEVGIALRTAAVLNRPEISRNSTTYSVRFMCAV
jgi:hypothetical protein